MENIDLESAINQLKEISENQEKKPVTRGKKNGEKVKESVK